MDEGQISVRIFVMRTIYVKVADTQVWRKFQLSRVGVHSCIIQDENVVQRPIAA